MLTGGTWCLPAYCCSISSSHVLAATSSACPRSPRTRLLCWPCASSCFALVAEATHVCMCADDQGAAQAVQQTQTAVSQLQQANMQQLQQWQTEAVGYVQELEAIHEVLQQLVGSCMVEEQPKIAQASGRTLPQGRRRCCVAAGKDSRVPALGSLRAVW